MERNKTFEDKKTQILTAALEIFAKQGLEKGKIADIAKVAKIGKGTVYEYFKTKDEIFRAIEKMFIFDSIDQINNLTQSEKSPTEKIEEIVNWGVNMHEVMGDATLIIAELWAQHGRGQLHGHKDSVFADMYNNYYGAVLDVLAQGIEDGEFRAMNKDGVASLLLAFMDGIIWQNVIFKNDKKFERRKKEAIKSFMNGIKK
ncbi:TetR/AcrR family transcriptional regulator [bacterium]|nr:TetR/AcrR family transcriptional regulator [bacterium]